MRIDTCQYKRYSRYRRIDNDVRGKCQQPCRVNIYTLVNFERPDLFLTLLRGEQAHQHGIYYLCAARILYSYNRIPYKLL